MRKIIIYGLLIMMAACYNTDDLYNDPDCNTSFEPYELQSNLYDIVEDDNGYWEYKRYYAVCRDNLVLELFMYSDLSKIIFSPNSLQKKGYLRIAQAEVSESDYPDYYNLRFDSILLVHRTVAGRPDFLNFFSSDFEIEEGPELLIEFDISWYQENQFSTYNYNASVYDVGIYKVDPKTKKVLKKVSVQPSEIFDIESFTTVSGMVRAELNEMGTYVAGIPIRKAFQPTTEGGYLSLISHSESATDSMYYLTDQYGGQYIDPFQEVAYTEIYLKNSGFENQQGHTQVVFYGDSEGTYLLNNKNFAIFSYLENGEIKTVRTTGTQGEIIVSDYEEIGGLINGSIVTTDPSGAVDLNGNPVTINVEFSVIHKLK
jgi:hypothetical protein